MTPYSRPPAPMPMDVQIALRDLTPAQAATMLAQAQQAYFNLLTGQLPSGVETPQLGRVTFAATSAADLQRLIDYLQGVVAGGGTNGSGYGNSGKNVRKPFSFYGWP
jgi:gpW